MFTPCFCKYNYNVSVTSPIITLNRLNNPLFYHIVSHTTLTKCTWTIWVLASTLAHSASEINKALSVTYKLLFILSKNIVPSRSYRYIRDRAFPVTACHPLYIQSLM